MELSTAYSTVVLCGEGGEPIKYHLATSAEIAPWVEAANSVADDAGTSHPDRFFADWLQDRDDPRHTIVRKDLELRSGPDTVYGNMQHKLTELTGVNDLEALERARRGYTVVTPAVDKHVLNVTKYSGLNNAYRLLWKIPNREISYTGVYTPEEFQQFLSDYGSNQKLKDFD